MFENLIVYISRRKEGGLRARVRQVDQVCAYYGSDMLKRIPTVSVEEAMFEVTRQLIGQTRTITFQFDSTLPQTTQKFSYMEN